ncbi:hypothetical protein L551_0797 [Bordetella pertussis STO1-SEAT-0004]|nr:hypothetical protein L551_0797 [Bordetella pertussis STO1-SEAT-0004]
MYAWFIRTGFETRCTHLQTQPGRIQPIDSSQLGLCALGGAAWSQRYGCRRKKRTGDAPVGRTGWAPRKAGENDLRQGKSDGFCGKINHLL